MSSVKATVRRVLKEMPDDASFEDIQYHIYVCDKIERGLAEVHEGHVIEQEDVERRMQKWLVK